MWDRSIGLAVAALLVLAAGAARAQSCAPEQEPNDDPASAQAVAAGFCIAGAAGDGPDMFRWTLSDEDAAAPWALGAELLPGETAKLQLRSIDPATGDTTIVESAATPAGGADVALAERSLPAGDYLVLLSVKGAPGLYHLTATSGAPAPEPLAEPAPVAEATPEAAPVPAPVAAAIPPGTACAPEQEPNDDATTAGIVPSVFCVAGSAADGTDMFRWRLSAADAGHLWSLKAESLPGQSLTIELQSIDDATGEVRSLTTEYGDYAALDVGIADRLLTAGDYLVLVSASGGAGLYHLSAIEGAALPPAAPDATTAGISNDTTIVAASDENGAIIPWRLDASGDDQRWDVSTQAPAGTPTTLTLADGSGVPITYAYPGEDGVARLSDLAPAPGEYQLQVSGGLAAGDPLIVTTAEAGPRDPSVETEPNNDVSQAFPFDPATGVTGRLIGNSGSQDADYFSLTLDESWRDRQFDLVLRAPETPNGLSLVLADDAGNDLQVRSGKGEVRLSDLALEPGIHYFQVRGSLPADQTYTVAVDARGTVAAGGEREPNDTAVLATVIDAADGATGRFVGSERDSFEFTVEGEAQLWRIEADGTALSRFVVDDTGGGQAVSAGPAGGGEHAQLSNIYLVPGRHVLSVDGTDGSYALRLVPLGRPDLARDELEPNDDLAHALRLAPGVERSGVLDHSGDQDFYRFSLAADEHVRLTITGLPETDMVAVIAWGDTNTEVGRLAIPQGGAAPAVWEGLLQPGDYYVALRASSQSTSPYKVMLDRQPYYARPGDLEPNSRPWLATALPPDLHITGTLGNEDADWYRLPDLDRETEITIRSRIGEADAFGVAYLGINQRSPTPDSGFWPRWDSTRVADVVPGDEPGTWRATVPAGTGLYLGIEGGSGAYDLDLTIPGHPAAAAPAAPAVTMALTLDGDTVAAFAADGQKVAGTLTLTNSGAQPLTLDLAAHTGDERWRVALDRATVDVPAGGSATVPVAVTVTPMARSGPPVTIAVGASMGGGPAAFAEASVVAVDAAPVVGAVGVPPLPEAVLGGLNVAWAGFGATMVADADGRLIDGLAGSGTTARFDRDTLATLQPVIQLAGDAPVTLAGVVLQPGMGNLASRLRDFSISVSTDGTSFQKVLDGRLSPVLPEQPFVFATPVAARYVRLEPHSNQSGDTEGYGADLGELAAIAVPGTVLKLPGESDGFDVARAERGGHIVRMTADIGAPTTLVGDDGASSFWVPDDQKAAGVEWVVGFRANRAAEIHALTWREGEGFDPTTALPTVRLAVSTEGADGPWTDLGRWAPERDGSGQARLDLPKPVWARYVRFQAELPADASNGVLPDRIGIIETPVDGPHPSILGEWGLDRPAGAYERSLPPGVAPAAIAAANAAGGTRETALALAPDQQVTGAVRLGAREDWYRLKVPADRPHLTLELQGQPADAVALTMVDAQGKDVELAEASTAAGRTFTADLAAGGYFVKVTEPPRSVILSWDTSLSVSPYTPEIVQSIMHFVSEIEPGREEVNLIPFGSDDGTKPLLERWSGDPLEVYSALQDYAWSDTSSNAEAALAAANEAFLGRPGMHAILIITDGESNGSARTPALWAGFDQTRPRIFAVGVPTDSAVPDVVKARAMMIDWAMLNGGSFRTMSSTGSVESAFDELSASLRAPAGYALTARLAVPPEPGRLAVTPAPGAPSDRPPLVADQAIEIIVDLSGSMLQRIDGERKSEIAKAILTDLVTNSLPAGLPFALRVFGQGAPGSCDTDLVSALSPLDPSVVADVIAPIEPTNLAKTPIAASLAAVRDDLYGATGKRLVILITDGEETCDGDPKAEIAGLREAGIDVRINIVGFALDDAALKDTFRDWAKLGGGAFFEATDKDTLAVAMDAAVQPEFDVVDANGAVVGHGTVGGEPIEVPAGPYTVRILSTPERAIEGVTVVPGEVTTVAAE